jgi:hypothetical protein
LVQENLVNQGFEITDEINAYIKEALQNSQAETAHVKVLEWFNGGRPIDFKKGSWAYRVIKDTGLTMVQIKDFFLAKHAPVRNEIGREIWQKEWDTKYLNLLDLIANSKTKATKDKYTALLDEHMQEEPPIAKSGMPTTEADKQLWIDRAKKAGMSKEYIEAIENTPSAEEILGREEYQKQGLEDTLKKYHAEFKKEVIDSATKRSVESGRISQESADSINSMEWYMPLKVDKASAQELGIEIGMQKKKGKKGTGQSFASFKGLTKEEGLPMGTRFDPISTALLEHKIKEEAAARNQTLRALGEFMSEVAIDDPEVEVRKLKTTVKIDKFGKVTGKLVDQIDSANSLVYLDNGVSYIINFTPMQGHPVHPIVRAFRSTPPSHQGPLVKLIKKVWRVAMNIMRQSLTNLSIVFPPVNFIKDLVVGGVNTKIIEQEEGIKGVTGKYFKNLVLAALRLPGTKMRDYLAEAEALGMLVNFSDHNKHVDENIKTYESTLSAEQVDRVRKGHPIIWSKKSLSAIVNLLNAWADYFENTTRLAIYVAARESGLSPEKAAFYGRESTLNFGRSGDKMRGANLLYLFINAGIQDASKGTQLLFNSKSQRIKEESLLNKMSGGMLKGKRLPSKVGMKVFGGAMLTGFMYRMMALALSDDDEDILFDQWTQKNYLVVPIPGSTTTFKLPKPYTILRAPWLMGEYLADTMFSYGDDTLKKFSATGFIGTGLGELMNTFDPIGATGGMANIAPTLLRPATEALLNKSWTGKDIINQYFFDKTDIKNYEKSYDNTPYFLREVSEFAYRAGIGRETGSPGESLVNPVLMDYWVQKTFFPGIIGDANELLSSLGSEKKYKNFIDRFTDEMFNEGKGGAEKRESDTDFTRMPLIKRFVEDSSVTPWKKGINITEIVNKKDDLTKTQYYYIKNTLKSNDMEWSNKKKKAYIKAFNNVFDEDIEKLGLNKLY